jgi:N-formylglutamate amidohydrolase
MKIDEIVRIRDGKAPVIATAIHAGHTIRPSLHRLSALTDAQRRQEEDPFTDLMAEVAQTSLVAPQSRFEVDLNRPRDRAVYRTPGDAWGLDLWTETLPEQEIALSLKEYDLFYATLKTMLDRHLEVHKRVVVLDIHSYNHRRGGPKAPFDDPIHNPEINIGTGTLTHREAWGEIIDPIKDILENGVVTGRFLDVRENVKFKGGEMAKWIHATYPNNVLCLSLEFKKIFMNEWNGEENAETISEIKGVMGEIVNFVETIL